MSVLVVSAAFTCLLGAFWQYSRKREAYWLNITLGTKLSRREFSKNKTKWRRWKQAALITLIPLVILTLSIGYIHFFIE